MVVIIVKEFVYSDDKVILIKVLRKKKELRRNIEQRMFYTLYFLFIFLRIVELLSFLYFHSSPTCSCWITLFHLVHAPRIERKTLREVVLSITNKRIRKNAGEKNKNGYTTLHKVTQAAVRAQRKVIKMVTQRLHKPQKLNQVQHLLRHKISKRIIKELNL